MDRQPVESSNILSIGYDPNEKIMEVEFKGNSVYQYFEVPEQLHPGIMQAESKGRYLHQRIRGKFNYKKVK